MASLISESELLAALLLQTPRSIPSLRLFRRQVHRISQGSIYLRAGVKGQCDLYGIVRGGKHIELELKSQNGRLSPAQRQWQAWCLEWKVSHLVLQALPDESIDQTVARWCGEISSLLSR
jgi:hypothetical protein